MPADFEALTRDLTVGLREALRTDVAVAYGVEHRNDGQRLSFVTSSGASEPFLSSRFRHYVEEQRARSWAAYDPRRPDPKQRNRAFAWSPAELELQRAPVYVDLFPTLGLRGAHQLRALVCDGPSLLGWVGCFQSSAFDGEQIGALSSLVPAMRRRLTLERRLAAGGLVAVLEAALEALGRPAFVVDRRGRVEEQNAPAKVLFDSDAGVRENIVEAVRGTAVPSWSVTPVKRSGVPERFLVIVEPHASARVATQVAKAKTTWSLTERQTDVLSRLAAGTPNQTIAAALGIAERTVEIHVTALLEKAQVASRAELVAKVFLLP